MTKAIHAAAEADIAGFPSAWIEGDVTIRRDGEIIIMRVGAGDTIDIRLTPLNAARIVERLALAIGGLEGAPN